jgi:hypothetical protein
MIDVLSGTAGSPVDLAALAAARASGVATVEVATDAEGTNAAEATWKLWCKESVRKTIPSRAHRDERGVLTLKSHYKMPSGVLDDPRTPLSWAE